MEEDGKNESCLQPACRLLAVSFGGAARYVVFRKDGQTSFALAAVGGQAIGLHTHHVLHVCEFNSFSSQFLYAINQAYGNTGLFCVEDLGFAASVTWHFR